MTPAKYVIEQFGNRSELARALGLSPSTVSRWTLSRNRGGCGGDIPAHHMRPILQLAWQRNLDITEKDLIHGRDTAAA